MFVYVISAGVRAHKIGLSQNVESRMMSLQTGHHQRLTIVGKVKVKDGIAVERYAHNLLTEDRILGEWFSVTAATAIAAIKEAAKSISLGKPHRWHTSPLRSRPAPPKTFTLAERASPEEGYYAVDSIEDALHRRALNDELYRRLVAPKPKAFNPQPKKGTKK